ncbi:MAG: signal peptidase I [Candidatus Izemoplasmatales bacterium]|jgi:signal peptidase I|nr:signal peptidase I [Candidatus Izemoplasmatales bacterium]
MKLLKKIFNILPFIFIALAMFLIINLGFSLKNEKVPSVFNRAMSYVKTGSMEPDIMAGDIIFIDTGETEFYVGDVISFKRPDKPEIIVTHEIQSITGDLVTTKGTANQISEDWEVNFSKDYIVGKYIGKSSGLGALYETLFIDNSNYLFALITIIFLLIVIIEFKNIIKMISLSAKEKKEEEKQKLIEEAKEKLREEMKDKT